MQLWDETEWEAGAEVMLQKLDPTVAQHAREIIWAYTERTLSTLESCKSPIEQLLAIYIEHLADLMGIGDQGKFFMDHQYPATVGDEEYRIDIILRAQINGVTVTLGVECDGHDYHERSKAQAARDKRRDRRLMSAGWRIVHFTGSEIYRDPRGCAREALRLLEDMATEPPGVDRSRHAD